MLRSSFCFRQLVSGDTDHGYRKKVNELYPIHINLVFKIHQLQNDISFSYLHFGGNYNLKQ